MKCQLLGRSSARLSSGVNVRVLVYGIAERAVGGISVGRAETEREERASIRWLVSRSIMLNLVVIVFG